MSKYFSLTPFGKVLVFLCIIVLLACVFDRPTKSLETFSATVIEAPTDLPDGRLKVRARMIKNGQVITLKLDKAKQPKPGDVVDVSILTPAVGVQS